MGIKFVLGTSGSGKTYYARHKAANLALAGEQVVLLVPEQFSFESERAMLDLLEAEPANNIEVFSFTRLAEKIAREVGGISGKRLDECGRAAVMNAAIEQVRDYLTLYSADKKGGDVVSSMLTAVNEFKLCAITPDMLNETAVNTSETVLSQKLKELSLIYGAYNACIANIGSIDPLDDLSRLKKNLDSVDYFEGKTVIVDSFTGFTRQEVGVIERIIQQSKEFVITLCCDTNTDFSDKINLFASVKDTIKILSEFDTNIEYDILNSHPRFSNDELKFVESVIFRLNKDKPCLDESDNVVIYSAADKYDEVEFVAREIRRLVRECELRWRDIAVICRNESDYQGLMLRALELQRIPYFCDKRMSITDSPIIRFVLAAMDVINGRWQSEDILRWIKTGMLNDISLVEAAKLENYCFIWNVNGGKWKQAFTQSPYGYTDKSDEREKEVLDEINASRICIVNLLNMFESTVKQENVKGIDIAAAVYNLIESSGADKCIERMIPKLSQEDADAQGQIWNALMNILDQLANILSDTCISLREFSDLFTLMVGLCDVGRIPQGMDEVVFGAADRIRTANTKVVFVLGANDGIFPMTPVQNGIFTENERKILINMQLPLSNNVEESAVSERFLAYSAMTCSSEKLYVTYSTSHSGEVMYCSEIISEIQRIMPNCKKITSCSEISIDMVENLDAGFLLAAECANDNTEFSESLTECYRKREEYSDKIEVMRQANLKSKLALHNKSIAYSLFGKNINVSASKAECFYSCKFMYFCKYGMRAAPRRRAELNPLEYGSVIHYVLENLLKNYDVGDLVDDKNLKDKIKYYLEKYLNEVMGGSDMKSARFLYLFRRLVETLTVLVIQLGEEFAKSLFTPESFETPIDGNEIKPLKISLSDDTQITIGGKIDRIDIFRSEGTSYVRVIDYKTGSKDFVLSDILSGLNMQMLIYLDILCDNATYNPAGVVYSPASLGRISGTRGETSFDKERQDMLKKNGLIIDDSKVINAMEIGMEKKIDKKSNASVKGASTFRSSATYVATSEQFEEIRRYVRSLLKQMGESLHKGEIDAFPAKGIYDACAYCDYRAICTQEQKNGGHEIKKKSISETIDIIEKAGE